MQVVCIDNSPSKYTNQFGVPSAGYLLKEGKTYTIIEEHEKGYRLLEVEHPRYPNAYWAKERFIPLSEIDETEFIRNEKTELV